MDYIWTELRAHRRDTEARTLAQAFAAHPGRFEAFSARLGDMVLDYSKTSVDAKARDLLIRLAESAGLAAKRDAMFAGEKINVTENRAVLHTALRNQGTGPVRVDGADVMPGIRQTLGRMRAFTDAVRSGVIAGRDGQAFTDVVNIGIGGSDLGPAMAVLALAPYHDGPRCHFVSNVDGAHVHDVLAPLDPARTLVIVASKTFTTIETMTNAATARTWLEKGTGGNAGGHFAAVSTALDRTAAFGIAPERVFGFEDWVGGRYSVWGPIGLSLMLAIGAANFDAFLRGGHEMDQHFRTAPLAQNLPVLLGLIGIWHNNICGYPTRAVLPYDQRLLRLPAYLQQLDMESNGKRVAMDGSPLDLASGPVVWGEPGTNGQHAFYQLIHQGTAVIPCEFIVGARGHEAELQVHQNLLLANCLAQSEALMKGRSFEEALAIVRARKIGGDEVAQARHRVFPGNRPSTTLLYRQLDPATLGRIIALYEHRVFVEGVIWGLNSFDQWGVELGKELATAIQPLIEGGQGFEGKDSSTAGLLREIARARA
jgi:glucose-6-phosphate isomerase